MYLKLKLKNVDLEKQLLAHKEVEVQLFKERTEMKRAIEKLERDLEISLKDGNKLSRLENRVKCLQDSYELELALESIIERLVRDLNKNEYETSNYMTVRKSKIQNIVDELSEISNQIENNLKDGVN